MGTISEKLTYLNGTKQAIKDELNRFGADLDNTDTFRSYSNVINDIYDKLPKVSANGTDFTLEKAQNGKLDSFGMEGNTEQTTYTGKNKYAITSAKGYTYSNSLPAVVSNNMVIDSYDLSNITFHTAGTQYLLVLLPTFELEPNTDYIINYTRSNNLTTGTAARRFIYEVDSSNNFSLIQQYFADEGFQAYQFTTGTTGKIAIAFGFSNNSSGSSSTVNNLMIRLATESDGTFEPYVGGTPSPNPDYPQDIRVVENEQIVNVSGKNLLPYPYTQSTITNNGVTFTVQNDGSVLVNGTASGGNANIKLYGNYQEINNKPFVGKYLSGGTNNVRLRALNNTNENYTVLANDTGSGAEIDTTTHKKGYIELTVLNGTTVNNQIVKPMVLNSLDYTTYEPYQSQDYEIDLGDIELCEIEDYKDVIFKNNQLSSYYDSTLDEDSWYIKKEIGKVVVDTSNITLRSNYTNIEYAEITKPNDFIGKGNYDDYNVYCSHAVSDIKNAIQYAWDSTYRIGKITNKATTDNLWLGFPKGTGLDNIKTALNGAIIYYALATPTYEKITNSTLINQLEAIKTETGTNIFEVSNENNVLPSLNVKRLKELEKLS